VNARSAGQRDATFCGSLRIAVHCDGSRKRDRVGTRAANREPETHIQGLARKPVACPVPDRAPLRASSHACGDRPRSSTRRGAAPAPRTTRRCALPAHLRFTYCPPHVAFCARPIRKCRAHGIAVSATVVGTWAVDQPTWPPERLSGSLPNAKDRWPCTQAGGRPPEGWSSQPGAGRMFLCMTSSDAWASAHQNACVRHLNDQPFTLHFTVTQFSSEISAKLR
jgi:hypothetical protein